VARPGRPEQPRRTDRHACTRRAWSSTTDLTDLGNAYPDVSVDGDGDALFVAASSRVVAQADDRAGPRLRDLSVPTAATVGVASSFAVSPIDAWSPLATTTWDFGDGATATGAAPTHTYATAGTKTVTVTATDALTHTSTTTAAVLVAPAPADPSPTIAAPGDAPAPAPAPAAVCASRRVITLHPDLPAGNKLRSASIEITGQETRRLNRWARNVTVDLRGVRLRSVTVRIKARTTAGKLLTDTRIYKTCGRPA
jgi:hypothetical protein